GISRSRSIAAIASLPQTRSEGWLGTGRSISLPAASLGLADGSSIVFLLELFISVPDVSRELPVAADLAPDDDVFPDDFLRRLRLRLQSDRADFTRRRAAQRQDIDNRQLGVAHLLRRLAPERLDRGATLDHCRTRREDIRILGVKRGNRRGVAFIEGRGPDIVELFDCRLVLGERRRADGQ